MIIDPTHFGMENPSKCWIERDKIRNSRSTIFYSNGANWNSQRLLCATTQTLVHGGRAWNSLKHTHSELHFIYALWFNSTLGLFIQWSQGQKQQPGRSMIRTKAIHKIPVPDFTKLSEKDVEKGKKLFKRISEEELLPFNKANIDRTRIAIDDAILEVMGLSHAKKIVNRIRDMWSNEPTLERQKRTKKVDVFKNYLPGIFR